MNNLPLLLHFLLARCEVILWIYSVLQVDFILGREIEIGGIYKGTVASIKEYGAFVEFNGGQQGLLHISEMSHEPVCSRNALLYSADSFPHLLYIDLY